MKLYKDFQNNQMLQYLNNLNHYQLNRKSSTMNFQCLQLLNVLI